MQSIVIIYFFYGLAFFSMGLLVAMEGGRSADQRVRKMLRPLAGFGFVPAIHSVAQGNVHLQPALARWLLEDHQRLSNHNGSLLPTQMGEQSHAGAGLDMLSNRERQVLELVTQGHNNQDIGARLDLSYKTIARHRERIMKKLNLHSRAELVKFAIRTRLITSE